MLPRPTEPPAEPPEEKNPQEGQPPQLSLEFWRSLVDEPGCRTTGVCNECGRCEH